MLEANGTGLGVHRKSEDREKLTERDRARFLRKILEGGVGIYFFGPESDRADARIASWFYCARLSELDCKTAAGKLRVESVS